MLSFDIVIPNLLFVKKNPELLMMPEMDLTRFNYPPPTLNG